MSQVVTAGSALALANVRRFARQVIHEDPVRAGFGLAAFHRPVDGFAIALFRLAFADLEQLSRLDSEFFDAFGDERVDIHRAIVGQGVLDAIAVPALDPYAVVDCRAISTGTLAMKRTIFRLLIGWLRFDLAEIPS